MVNEKPVGICPACGAFDAASRKVDTANARLIAAAPEMLEALRTLDEHPYCQAEDHHDPYGDGRCNNCRARAVVRKLLARIDGGNHETA